MDNKSDVYNTTDLYLAAWLLSSYGIVLGEVSMPTGTSKKCNMELIYELDCIDIDDKVKLFRSRRAVGSIYSFITNVRFLRSRIRARLSGISHEKDNIRERSAGRLAINGNI
jgi:hypothetical protein